MKALNRKKRVKCGRPRIQNKLREKNGRISRAKKPNEPPAKLAIETRARHFGISFEAAKNQMVVSYIGRMVMLGHADGLSQNQYDAAQLFLKIRNEYRCSILSPGAYYEATGIRLGQENMQEYTAWVMRARKRYSSVLKAIQEAQFKTLDKHDVLEQTLFMEAAQ